MQSDYLISANPTGLAMREEINTIFESILTKNSGDTAPTTTKPFMYWADTSNVSTYYVKQRTHDDAAWVSIFSYDVVTKTFQPLSNGNLLAEITALTGAVHLPAGTTAQRPTLSSGDKALRFNTTLASLEYWNGTTWGSISSLDINALTAKTTPIDTDNTVIQEVGGALKKLSWANLKATLKTYFDTIYTTGIKLAADGFSIVKSDNSTIKNACTAWVNFDGTTTPPTIRDSYNISDVVRTATGLFEAYFEEDMDNDNYSTLALGAVTDNTSALAVGQPWGRQLSKVSIRFDNQNGSPVNRPNMSVHIFGGK